MAQTTISMEAALDEERIDVLALLEGTSHGARREPGALMGTGMREPSPYTAGGSPRSPVRSMLDIGVPIRGPYRSMLDIDSPIDSPIPLKESQSEHASPTDPNNKIQNVLDSYIAHPRSFSDAASRPASFGPRSLPERKADPIPDYRFSGFLTNVPGAPYTQKRPSLPVKKTFGPSLSDAVKGDLSAPGIGIGASGKSRSPHNRLGPRSNSPHSSMLSAGLKSTPGKFTLDSGAQIDMNSAYRHLSDANLARASGSLATLSTKGHSRQAGDRSARSPHHGRLEKDGHPEDVSSSEEAQSYSSDDEEGQRGRKKNDATGLGDDGPESSTIEMGRTKGPRVVLSLMAAVEEERKTIAKTEEQKQYKVRSLLDPEITVTGPGGDRLKPSKPVIHPNNAFDQGGPSGVNTPLDSGTEADIHDIRRAQKLAVIMTPIASYPEVGRCVRTLYRGDFTKTQQEAQDDQRRVRKYLVATDLSDEAAHALEWTIGTVLRDGDTLLSIYCVDEETSIRPEAAATEDQISVGQAATITATTNTTQVLGALGAATIGLASLGSAHSTPHSPVGRERSRAEQERYRAVEDITERVTRLLRKTKLQVRVVIEVIHCKSPKHLITEVIDFISPTLVILGSRGRSALKGVILGSFSNYLVTKSSVPVMVARKKLRKHSKYKRPSVKLANNLDGVSSRSLSAARVDELTTG